MTDQELLERAARAAGIDLEWDRDHPLEVFPRWSGNPSEPPEKDCRNWNPLVDDGDALRLANACKLSIQISDDDGGCTRILSEFEGVILRNMHEHQGVDAATRRAIVRAAASVAEDV